MKSAPQLVVFVLLAFSAFKNVNGQQIQTVSVGDTRYHVSAASPYSAALSWHLAYQYCRTIGMELLTLSNNEDTQQLYHFLQSNGYDRISFWTSGNKLGSPDWLWMVTGLPYNATFSYWPNGQTPITKNESSCMSTTSQEWQDSNCADTKHYICQLTRCFYFNYVSSNADNTSQAHQQHSSADRQGEAIISPGVRSRVIQEMQSTTNSTTLRVPTQQHSQLPHSITNFFKNMTKQIGLTSDEREGDNTKTETSTVTEVGKKLMNDSDFDGQFSKDSHTNSKENIKKQSPNTSGIKGKVSDISNISKMPMNIKRGSINIADFKGPAPNRAIIFPTPSPEVEVSGKSTHKTKQLSSSVNGESQTRPLETKESQQDQHSGQQSNTSSTIGPVVPKDSTTAIGIKSVANSGINFEANSDNETKVNGSVNIEAVQNLEQLLIQTEESNAIGEENQVPFLSRLLQPPAPASSFDEVATENRGTVSGELAQSSEPVTDHSEINKEKVEPAGVNEDTANHSEIKKEKIEPTEVNEDAIGSADTSISNVTNLNLNSQLERKETYSWALLPDANN